MIQHRKYTKKTCVDCGKNLKIRNDYIKKHRGRCQSCAKKHDWEDQEYRRKCSEAHKGHRYNPPLPWREASFNNILHIYKKSAQDRGIIWSLTKKQFKLLTKQNCHYCDIEPLQIASPKKFKYGDWIYNGIDRLRDDKGYEINNVVSCCKKCNYAKQGLTDKEFFDLIKKIYKNHLEEDTIGSRTET